MFRPTLALVTTALLVTSLPALAAAPTPAADALALLEKSISFRTVEGQGQVPAYAQFLAQRLDKRSNLLFDINHDKVGALTVTQCPKRLLCIFTMNDFGTTLQGNFPRRTDITFKLPDNH